MRAWKVAAAASLVVVGAAGVRLASADEPQAKADQDKVKVERELKELEGQREKITSRIRELRKQLGHDEDVRILKVGPGGKEFKGLSEDQRIEIKRAIEHSHKAVEEALRNLPDVKTLIPDVKALIPDLDKIIDKEVPVYVDKDGKNFQFDKLDPEQREKIKREMSELREKMRGRGEEIRARIEERRKSLPRERELRIEKGGSSDPELRREMDQLREEMRQLREELRRELKKGSGKQSSGSFEVL